VLGVIVKMVLLVLQMASHAHPQQQTCGQSASSSVRAASAGRAQHAQPSQQQQVRWQLQLPPPLLLLLVVQLRSAMMFRVCFQQQQRMGQLMTMMIWT
jgi:hypothetical protein